MTINITAREQILLLLQQALISEDQVDQLQFEAQLFEVYFPLLYPIAYKYFKDAEVDDVMQDFYIKKVRKIWTLKNPTSIASLETISDFENYLFRAFHNHCLTILKKKRRRLDKEEYQDMGASAFKMDASRLLFDVSAKKRLRPYLKILNSRQQIALWLKVEGFSNRQIGKVLNISDGAVADLILRSKEKIRNHLLTIKAPKKSLYHQKGLSELIATIPDPKSQELLKLFFFTDMAYQGIAETLNLDLPALKRATLSTLVHIRRYYKAA